MPWGLLKVLLADRRSLLPSPRTLPMRGGLRVELEEASCGPARARRRHCLSLRHSGTLEALLRRLRGRVPLHLLPPGPAVADGSARARARGARMCTIDKVIGGGLGAGGSEQGRSRSTAQQQRVRALPLCRCSSRASGASARRTRRSSSSPSRSRSSWAPTGPARRCAPAPLPQRASEPQSASTTAQLWALHRADDSQKSCPWLRADHHRVPEAGVHRRAAAQHALRPELRARPKGPALAGVQRGCAGSALAQACATRAPRARPP